MSCRTRPELGCVVVVMVVLRAFLGRVCPSRPQLGFGVVVVLRVFLDRVCHSRPKLGCGVVVVASQGDHAAPSQPGRLKLVISR